MNNIFLSESAGSIWDMHKSCTNVVDTSCRTNLLPILSLHHLLGF